jgi:hypothetical protein
MLVQGSSCLRRTSGVYLFPTVTDMCKLAAPQRSSTPLLHPREPFRGHHARGTKEWKAHLCLKQWGNLWGSGEQKDSRRRREYDCGTLFPPCMVNLSCAKDTLTEVAQALVKFLDETGIVQVLHLCHHSLQCQVT